MSHQQWTRQSPRRGSSALSATGRARAQYTYHARRAQAMKRIALAVMVWPVIASSHAADSAKPDDFYGTWKVTKIVAVGYVSTSEAGMDALIGTNVTISAKQLTAGGDVFPLEHHTVIASIVDTDKDPDLRLGRIPPKQLGLPHLAPKLDAGCMMFYKAGDRLIFGDRGAYYSANRIH